MVFKNKEWIMTEKDIEKLLQLKKENPDMDVIFKCDEDIFVCDETFMATFTMVEKSFYAEYGEKYFLNRDDLSDAIYDDIFMPEDLTDDEIDDLTATKIKEIEQEKIIIWVGV
jgi:hypothetical protein